jgi:ribosomal protein L14E/L6E/L27E
LEIKLGQIVYSRAGRDEGKKFIVVEVPDSVFAMIADGNLRRIEKPKRKKLKHLELTDQVIDNLNYKLTNDIKVTNADIRKAMEVL